MLIKTKLDSNEFLDGQFENGSDGTLFEYELTYPLSSTDNGTAEGLKVTQDGGTIGGTGIAALSPDPGKEGYRWYFLIKNNRSRDNYAPLINALAKVGQSAGTQFHTDTAATLDVDAVRFAVGDRDARLVRPCAAH